MEIDYKKILAHILSKKQDCQGERRNVKIEDIIEALNEQGFCYNGADIVEKIDFSKMFENVTIISEEQIPKVFDFAKPSKFKIEEGKLYTCIKTFIYDKGTVNYCVVFEGDVYKAVDDNVISGIENRHFVANHDGKAEEYFRFPTEHEALSYLERNAKEKIGLWVTDGISLPLQIIDADAEYYYTSYGNLTRITHADFEDNYHVWRVNDAKPGDLVITKYKSTDGSVKTQIGIAKKYLGRNYKYDFIFDTYAYIDWEGTLIVNSKMPCADFICPANDQERDTFFRILNSRGFKWNSYKFEIEWVNEDVMEKTNLGYSTWYKCIDIGMHGFKVGELYKAITNPIDNDTYIKNDSGAITREFDKFVKLDTGSDFKLPYDIDKECVKLVITLNKLSHVTTTESCCGHFKEPYMIFFDCDDMVRLGKLYRCVDRNYSDGKWRIEICCSDGHPCNGFLLTSKVPFRSKQEMRESVNGLIENIDYWEDKSFDEYFETNGK